MRRVLTNTSVVRCACDELGQAIVDLLPHLRRHHRFERSGRHFEREIARAPMAGVDDGARRLAAVRAGADQEARHRFDRLLGGREADALQSAAAERRQALQRKQQMRAALVRRQRMDLIDDHGAGGLEHRAAGFRAEQHVERFRRRDHDVRRGAAHAVALARRRIAGPHPGSDFDVGQTLLAQRCADAGERRLAGCAGCRSTVP